MLSPLTAFVAILSRSPGASSGSGPSGAAGAQEHAAGAAQEHLGPGAQEHGSSGEFGTEEMMHHVADATTLDFGFATLNLDALSLPPIHVAGFEIDLSITKHVIFLFFASILTIVTLWAAARQERRLQQGAEAPGGLLNAMEAFYLYLRDEVALANVGHGGERFVPYVITLFFFILYANLLGLVPWGATATSNIMVTGALAFISFVVVEVSGYQTLGPKGYLGTIFYIPAGLHPVMKAVMLVIMPVVELIGKLAKPFALAVRLFANMTAGHLVLLTMLGLILSYGSFSAATGITAVAGPLLLGLFVMFLEIFVAFLQAYIFAVLTAVFIGLIRQH